MSTLPPESLPPESPRLYIEGGRLLLSLPPGHTFDAGDFERRIQQLTQGRCIAKSSDAYLTEKRDADGQWTKDGSATSTTATPIKATTTTKATPANATTTRRATPPTTVRRTTTPPSIPKGTLMPRTGFVGVRGHSDWVSEDAAVRAVTGGRTVSFKNGFPIFGPFVHRISGKSATVQITLASSREKDFALADAALARKVGWMNAKGQPDAARVRRLRRQESMVWHHHQDCGQMQLVPAALHSSIAHAGGFSLCSQSE